METITKPFSKEFWKEFIHSNNDFQKPCVVNNAIDCTLVKELNNGVLNVLQNRFKLSDVGDGIRVYIDGEEQSDQYLLSLCKNPPKKDENIEEFTSRIFDKKFGIIINSGEKHSTTIANKIRKAIKPLLAIKGVPATGVEITIFIGNYGWTPLGIHQDHPGENVLHFHLGPGKKSMYTWDEDKYDSLTNDQTKYNNKNIEPILEHANQFEFSEGDLFYMPWKNYHVGFSDELSVGVTLWFNNPTKEIYTKKIVRSLIYQFESPNENTVEKTILQPSKKLLENEASFSTLLSTLNLDESTLKLPTKDFLYQLNLDYKYALLSNGCWQSIPLSKNITDSYDVEKYNLLIDKIVQSNSNFELLYYTRNNKLILFSRGIKMEMKYHKELEKIIDLLNTHQKYPVKELLSDLAKEWPIEAGLYFISEIYNYNGVEII
ncbi:cupin domain-containing protein [Aquimarina agarivorans]|uniref:cupin domain-containing protein n=1 Tax=Aquimarina agarivorans TaxID=980584 RepID=UPI000248E7C3|nr:cupin domain-containing protein [Aquimarina agarivorans]